MFLNSWIVSGELAGFVFFFPLIWSLHLEFGNVDLGMNFCNIQFQPTPDTTNILCFAHHGFVFDWTGENWEFTERSTIHGLIHSNMLICGNLLSSTIMCLEKFSFGPPWDGWYPCFHLERTILVVCEAGCYNFCSPRPHVCYIMVIIERHIINSFVWVCDVCAKNRTTNRNYILIPEILISSSVCFDFDSFHLIFA